MPEFRDVREQLVNVLVHYQTKNAVLVMTAARKSLSERSYNDEATKMEQRRSETPATALECGSGTGGEATEMRAAQITQTRKM
jgi:hypothetical protein